MPVLQVANLYKSYTQNDIWAVEDVSFLLQAGEILGLLGPNGSGKTTTIQMLLGTLTPTRGSIVYFGKNFTDHKSAVLQKISFASAYSNMPFVLTVKENLTCFGLLYGLKNPIKNAKPLLERFGIEDKIHAKVSSLSAGQMTRLMLVKAFFMNPEIVLLDEPTASLDPDIARDICSFLLEIRKKTGLSILFTSHKMQEVAEVCDRVLVLKNGKIIANDLPKNLAKSSGLHILRLTIIDGLQRLMELAENEDIYFTVDNRSITCRLEDYKIPAFLEQLVHLRVSYASIEIEEPTLEDYFLKISKQDQA